LGTRFPKTKGLSAQTVTITSKPWFFLLTLIEHWINEARDGKNPG